MVVCGVLGFNVRAFSWLGGVVWFWMFGGSGGGWWFVVGRLHFGPVGVCIAGDERWFWWCVVVLPGFCGLLWGWYNTDACGWGACFVLV